MSEDEGGTAPEGGRTVIEETKVQARDLQKNIEKMVHEGRVRRLQVIRKGRTILDIPFGAGVAAGAVMVLWMPQILAIAALGAVLGGCTIRVEREESQE
ncbi:MAG TPA: DUF4342 domain-containing protein [Anaerolineae bacterium]|nr:DUF4342 domain-containing protein [Anaerolineae bacterium]